MNGTLTEQLLALYTPGLGVSTDSRTVKPQQIYFALRGENFDGNGFALQALDAGAVAAVVNQDFFSAHPHPRFIPCNDPLHELQQLALAYRKTFRFPVLAITGSNGKTTTKELIAAVLSKKFKTSFTQGNLNNHIGIPLTLLSVPPDATFAVIEMGANHQHEIESYCEYVLPDSGLITNCGKAHLEGFGGVEGVVKGKTELYRFLKQTNGKVFVNADDPVLTQAAQNLTQITYGESKNADYRAQCLFSASALTFVLETGQQAIEVKTHLAGKYNFYNALAAVAIGKYYGVNDDDIVAALQSYLPKNNRSQWMEYQGNQLLMDAYNANPSSMEEALKSFNLIDAEPKGFILGEMMELGPESEYEHRKIAELALSISTSIKIFTGKGFAFLKSEPQVIYFENTRDLAEWWKTQHFTGLTLLVKGSRANKLESVFL